MPEPTTDVLAAFVAPSDPIPLTPADFAWAAAQLGCRMAVVRAFAEKESRGSGYDTARRPKILYERHVFRRNTGGQFDKAAPDLSNPSPGGYGKESGQYPKLARAMALHRIAALKACSWGAFQILGENHKEAGFQNVTDMVDAMVTGGPAAHLAAFVSFIRSWPRLHQAVVAGDTKTMARLYNGPDFAKNDYDTDMDKLIARYEAEAQTPPAAAPAVAPATPPAKKVKAQPTEPPASVEPNVNEGGR